MRILSANKISNSQSRSNSKLEWAVCSLVPSPENGSEVGGRLGQINILSLSPSSKYLLCEQTCMCDLGAFPHPVLIQALLGPEIANCLNHAIPIHIA